jgi:hypothetical protein
MLHKRLAAVAVAAIMVTAFSALPADAARREKRSQSQSDTTSLDGRTTGQPRTCGYDYFQYDSRGVPRGPYCH